MSEFKKVEQKRLVYVTRITETFTAAVKAQTDTSVRSMFKTRYENLDEFYEEFKQLHNQVIGLVDTDDEFKIQDKVRKDTDNFYFQAKDIFNQLFPNQNTQHNFVINPNQNSDNDYKDLLKLDVPIFDGNLLKWVTFYDMFCSLVHNNSNIAPVRKFRYLISYLRGEPLNLIKSLPVNNDNYIVAFQTLTDRYQNKRLLATNYWNTINNTILLKNNCSSRDLRALLDIFNENISALNLLKFPTKEWDFPLFNMLLSRLNTSIRTAFEIEHSKIELPTYENLKEFLKNHCRALESVQIMPNISQYTMQSNNSQNTNNTNSKNFKNQYNSNNSYSKSYQPQSYITNTIPNTQNTQMTQFNPNIQSNPNQSNPNHSKSNHSNSNHLTSNYQSVKFNTQNKYKCRLCNQSSHSLSQCETFLQKNINDRIVYVRQNKACNNCLRFSHTLNLCQSTFSCRVCGQRHHTLICTNSQTNPPNYQNTYITNVQQPIDNLNQNSSQQSQTTHPNTIYQSNQNEQINDNTQYINCGCTSLTTQKPKSTVLLSTTKVDILDIRGNYQTVRVVLDNASEANFITENCLNRLGLSRKKVIVPIRGINQSTATTKGLTSCTIKPVGKNNPLFSFDVYVLPIVSANLPSLQINSHNWHHISNIKLGDDSFNIPAPVDMLLGAEVYSQIIKPNIIPGQPGQPIALDTLFGWVLLGSAETSNKLPNNSFSCHLTSLDNLSLDQTMSKFWEIESLPTKKFLSPDEVKCESFYQKTVKREDSGRFQVSLPFRHSSRPVLGDTYNHAYKCFLSLESRLLKNPELYLQYSEFMNNYLKNNHMSLIPKSEPQTPFINYLPHHCVVRPDKSSTKVRVVFNASAKGSKGISLNSTLLPGPKLQTDINTIILKFRFHEIVILSDITQMFLQIRLAPVDRDYQRLLWRFNSNDPIQEYRLNTVTFGVTSSPYLSIRTIQELAKIQQNKYPEASRVLLEDIFVDDICAGANSLQSALALQRDLIALLKSGCFELKKWASNHPKLLSSLLPDECQIPFSFDRENPISIKVLGLQWDPKCDSMFFSCQQSEGQCTK